MEEEIIRYRQASFKGKLIIAKRFSKFYINEFRPITKLESADLEKARYIYRSYTGVGAIICGFISFRFRRAKLGAMGTAGVSRENNLPIHIVNDICAAFLGLCVGQFTSVDYIYRHRQYVVDRVSVERANGWSHER